MTSEQDNSMSMSEFEALLVRFFAGSEVDGHEVASHILGLIEELAPSYGHAVVARPKPGAKQ